MKKSSSAPSTGGHITLTDRSTFCPAGPRGGQAGRGGAGPGGGVPPAAIIKMFAYAHFDPHPLFSQLDCPPTAGMPPVKPRALGPDPRAFVPQALQYMTHNRRVAPYE